MKVTLCLGSQSFQKRLAMTLARRGMLARVLSFGPDAEIFDPDPEFGLKLIRRYPHYRLANRVLWAAWRRLPMTSRSRNFPVVLTTAYLDRLLSRGMPATDLFHGWTGLSMAGMRAARRYQAATMIENPSMHPRDWQSAVLRECAAWGLRPRDCHTLFPEPLIRRMEKEFALADFIVVPSAVAAASFARAGLGSKALVMHAGVDHSFFKPSGSAGDRHTFRVCYAGRVDLGKGIVYLLKAWKMLALKDAELIMAGQVTAEMNAIVRDYTSPGVQFKGLLSPAQLAETYRNADVFAFPSVNEGLARVLLEAMASGLPVVATDCSGAADCITPGVEGAVIPARDADALAQALLWHYQNREATREMGKAARARVEAEFTVAHYEERMIRAYREVLNRRRLN